MSNLMSPQSLDLCIQCISNDLSDIDNSLQSISPQCEELENYVSWKFPTLKAHSIDIPQYLDKMCQDTQDKLNHYILLLELTIDRFVFLLNLLTERLGALINGQRSSSVSKFTSLGLAINKYWVLLSFLNDYFLHINSQQRTYARKISQLEQQISDSSSENSFGRGSLPSKQEIKEGLAVDYSVKGTQTERTCFVPCEGCHRTDLVLKRTCTEILTFCEKNKIKSMIKDVFDYFPTECEDGMESAFQIIDALKEDVSKILSLYLELEINCKNSHKMAETLETEQRRERSNYEQDLTRLEGQIKHVEATNDTTNDEKAKIQLELEEVLGNLRESERRESEQNLLVTNMKASISQLEIQRDSEVREKSDLSTKIISLEKRCEDSDLGMNKMEQKLAELAALVDQEKRSKSLVEGRLKTVQDKQSILLDRIEELSESSSMLNEENVDLRERLTLAQNESEARNELLRNMTKEKIRADVAARTASSGNLSATMKENEELKKLLFDQSEALKSAKTRINELDDHLKLLLYYPDLNGPLPTTSGNILQDMKNQIEANELRIALLEQQTKKMRYSVTKMEDSAFKK